MKGKRQIQRTVINLIAILLSISVLVVFGSDARAAGTVKVDSMDEFYNELSDQIYDRDSYRYYSTDNEELSTKIKHFDMIDYGMHYREDKPFLSGCYLSYYIESMRFSITSKGTKVLIQLPYTKEEMDKHFANLDKLAVELKGSTDYDTIKNVHDYLVENFEYDYRSDMANHTDIDGFRDGEMVCSGYSLAAYYLLNSAGISTRTVLGSSGDDKSGNITHMWNVVKLDGRWYNLDITWDDPGGGNLRYDYFLKSDEDFSDHTRAKQYNSDNFRIVVSNTSYKQPVSAGSIMDYLLLAAAFVVTFAMILYRKDKKL